MESGTALAIGQRVFYTGDQANDPAWLTVVAPRGENSYDLQETETGRIRRGVMFVGSVYAGHCDPRYVTGEAYDTHMAARTARRPSEAVCACCAAKASAVNVYLIPLADGTGRHVCTHCRA